MTPDKAFALIRQYFSGEEEATGMGALVTNQSTGLAGFAGLIPTDCLGAEDFELGFALFAWAEGRNYPAEIGLAQMQYAFDILKLPRILALAHPENGASLHVLRNKLQMEEISRWAGDMHRGPRIVFCRNRSDGLPAGVIQVKE
jgi:RimJ/RimL family protein N-acetyltransferase